MTHSIILLHLSRLPYDSIFGGATILNDEQMRRIHGFTNVFFGWGGEDDNIALRYVTCKIGWK